MWMVGVCEADCGGEGAKMVTLVALPIPQRRSLAGSMGIGGWMERLPM